MVRRLAVILILLGSLALVVGSVSAQATLTVKPTQLIVNGVRGQSLVRTLLIQTAAGLDDLQVVGSELTDGGTTVLTPVIGPDAPAMPLDLAGEELLSIPVTFDLSAVTPGTYTGELLITYAGGSQTVPLQVRVKAQPWLPLAALVGGVALGVGVSSYRAKGRPRDEVMVRLGQIRTQMKVDEELHTLGNSFLALIQAKLVDVEAALEAQQWDQAQTAAESAAAVWTRWRRYRPDWIVQLSAFDRFVDWLSDTTPDARYISELRQAASDLSRNAPHLEGPQAFRKELERLRERANGFVELLRKISMLGSMGPTGVAQAAIYRDQLETQSALADDHAQHMASLSGRVSDSLAKLRREELEAMLSAYGDLGEAANAEAMLDYQAQIDELEDGSDSAYLELHTEIAAMLASAQPGTSKIGTHGAPTTLEQGEEEGLALRPMGALPQVHVQSLQTDTLTAKRRLRWFTWLTYGITVALLALAGFVQLYGTRVDFGQNAAADYLALLVWGFGAEATRSAVAEMVQSWGIVRQ